MNEIINFKERNVFLYKITVFSVISTLVIEIFAKTPINTILITYLLIGFPIIILLGILIAKQVFVREFKYIIVVLLNIFVFAILEGDPGPNNIIAIFGALALATFYFDLWTIVLSGLTGIIFGIAYLIRHGHEVYAIMDNSQIIIFVAASAVLVIIHAWQSRIGNKMNSELKESRNKLQMVLSSVNEVIFRTNIRGDFIFINPSWEVLSEYNTNESIGTNFSDYIYKEDRETNIEYFEQLVSGEIESFKTECRGVTRSGKTKWVEVSVSILKESNGSILGTTGTIIDIADRKKAQIQMIEAKKTAESANRLKSQFVANISHELRTPLNAILGIAELLEDTSLQKKQKEYVDILHSSSQSLLNLINDILDLSRLDAGKREVKTSDINISKVIEDIRNTFIFESKRKNIKLNTNIDENIPAIKSDQILLKQILLNLTGNAMKFTDEGQVTISALCQSMTGSEVEVVFKVQDTGIGIPDNEKEKLFKPFLQVDGSSTREYGGTGLGLAISKMLVELINGEIGVDSVEGEGSTFWVKAKFKIAQGNAQKDTIIEKKENAYKGKKVLLVEDSIANQKIAGAHLKKLGFIVDIASNGEQAIEMHKENEYEVIFMDCQMPVIDGYEATRIIRKREEETKAHTLIIALTANAVKEDLQKCIMVGMDDYLTKPVSSNKIFEMIQKHSKKLKG